MGLVEPGRGVGPRPGLLGVGRARRSFPLNHPETQAAPQYAVELGTPPAAQGDHRSWRTPCAARPDHVPDRGCNAGRRRGIRTRENLAACSPTCRQRPQPARCRCTAPDWGAGRRQRGDGARLTGLQRERGRDGGFTEPSAGGSTCIMERAVWNPDGVPCVRAESFGLRRGVMGHVPGAGGSRKTFPTRTF